MGLYFIQCFCHARNQRSSVRYVQRCKQAQGREGCDVREPILVRFISCIFGARHSAVTGRKSFKEFTEEDFYCLTPNAGLVQRITFNLNKGSKEVTWLLLWRGKKVLHLSDVRFWDCIWTYMANNSHTARPYQAAERNMCRNHFQFPPANKLQSAWILLGNNFSLKWLWPMSQRPSTFIKFQNGVFCEPKSQVIEWQTISCSLSMNRLMTSGANGLRQNILLHPLVSGSHTFHGLISANVTFAGIQKWKLSLFSRKLPVVYKILSKERHPIGN